MSEIKLSCSHPDIEYVEHLGCWRCTFCHTRLTAEQVWRRIMRGGRA